MYAAGSRRSALERFRLSKHRVFDFRRRYMGVKRCHKSCGFFGSDEESRKRCRSYGSDKESGSSMSVLAFFETQ